MSCDVMCDSSKQRLKWMDFVPLLRFQLMLVYSDVSDLEKCGSSIHY